MRVEIETKTNSDNYNIVPFGKKGVLLLYQIASSSSDHNANWVISLYDINFKEIWLNIISNTVQV